MNEEDRYFPWIGHKPGGLVMGGFIIVVAVSHNISLVREEKVVAVLPLTVDSSGSRFC